MISLYESILTKIFCEREKKLLKSDKSVLVQYSSYKAVWQIPILLVIAYKNLFIARN